MSRSKPKSKKTGSKPARRPRVKAVARPARTSAKKHVRKPARKAASGGAKRSKTSRGARPARPARPAGPVKAVTSVKKPKAVAASGRPKPERPAKVRVLPASPRVQKLRAMLEAKGAEIVEKIRRARAESLDADRTSFAEVGDLVSASVEKEKAFESGEAGVNAMREIAGALEKLKGGTYGICERCSKPIGLKRLEAMPSARLCVKCKAKEEAVGKIAAPPADNSFED